MELNMLDEWPSSKRGAATAFFYPILGVALVPVVALGIFGFELVICAALWNCWGLMTGIPLSAPEDDLGFSPETGLTVLLLFVLCVVTLAVVGATVFRVGPIRLLWAFVITYLPCATVVAGSVSFLSRGLSDLLCLIAIITWCAVFIRRIRIPRFPWTRE